jgi:hypothetical protein
MLVYLILATPQLIRKADCYSKCFDSAFSFAARADFWSVVGAQGQMPGLRLRLADRTWKAAIAHECHLLIHPEHQGEGDSIPQAHWQ